MTRANDPDPSGATLVDAAETTRRVGRLTEARQSFMLAAAATERAGDDTAFIDAALGVGGLWVYEQRDVVERQAVNAVWERAHTIVKPGSLEAARLSVRRAAEAVYERGASAQAVADAAESVRSLGRDGSTAEALSLLHHVQLGPRYAESRLALANEIVRLGVRAQDSFLTLVGLCWRTVDLFLLGNSGALQSLVELREREREDPCEAIGFIADVLDAMLMARRGRLDEAETAAGIALERGTDIGDPDALAYYGATVSVIRWWQGRSNEVLELVRSISTSPRLGFNDHVYVAADAALSASVGDVDSAEEALARLDAIGFANLPESSSWLTTLALVVEAAYLLGDPHIAHEAGQLLAPFAHLPVMPSLAVACLGSTERSLGLTAATGGHLDAAVHHLEAAVVVDRRLANRPMAVFTEHTLAAVLHARGAPGDAKRSAQLADRADERAIRIGMELPGHPAWLASGHAGASRASPPRTAFLAPCSSGWRIEVDQRATVIPDRVGISYLAQLVERPNCDIDAVALASIVGANPLRPAIPVIDHEALRNYRRRARELTEQVARADLDPTIANEHREELAWLASVVQSGTGLHGRVRRFPDDQERARTAVRKAMVRALRAITDVDADLGRHLQASLITGGTCRYAPQPGWAVTVRAKPDGAT